MLGVPGEGGSHHASENFYQGILLGPIVLCQVCATDLEIPPHALLARHAVLGLELRFPIS